MQETINHNLKKIEDSLLSIRIKQDQNPYNPSFVASKRLSSSSKRKNQSKKIRRNRRRNNTRRNTNRLLINQENSKTCEKHPQNFRSSLNSSEHSKYETPPGFPRAKENICFLCPYNDEIFEPSNNARRTSRNDVPERCLNNREENAFSSNSKMSASKKLKRQVRIRPTGCYGANDKQIDPFMNENHHEFPATGTYFQRDQTYHHHHDQSYNHHHDQVNPFLENDSSLLTKVTHAEDSETTTNTCPSFFTRLLSAFKVSSRNRRFSLLSTNSSNLIDNLFCWTCFEMTGDDDSLSSVDSGELFLYQFKTHVFEVFIKNCI